MDEIAELVFEVAVSGAIGGNLTFFVFAAVFQIPDWNDFVDRSTSILRRTKKQKNFYNFHVLIFQ